MAVRNGVLEGGGQKQKWASCKDFSIFTEAAMKFRRCHCECWLIEQIIGPCLIGCKVCRMALAGITTGTQLLWKKYAAGLWTAKRAPLGPCGLPRGWAHCRDVESERHADVWGPKMKDAEITLIERNYKGMRLAENVDTPKRKFVTTERALPVKDHLASRGRECPVAVPLAGSYHGSL